MNRFLSYIKDIIRLNKKGMFLIFNFSIVQMILSIWQPKIMQSLIDEGIQNNNVKILVRLFIVLLFVSLIQNLAKYIITMYHTKVKKRYTYRIKMDIFNRITKQSGKEFNNQRTGELIKVIESDIYAIENAGVDLIIDILFNIVISICAIVMLFQLNKRLMFLVLIIETIIVFGQKYLIEKMYQKVKELREISGRSMSLTEEYVANIVNFIIAKTEKFFMLNFQKVEQENIKKNIEYRRCTEGGRLFSQSMNAIIVAVIYLVSGINIIKGRMTFGSMVAFLQYTYMLINPFLMIINSYSQIQNMLVSVNKVYDILDEPVREYKGAVIDTKDLDIEISNVTFGYRDDEQVLKNVSMKFPPNSKTAIIGESGSGKSTIAKLIYALWDVNSGEVRLNKKCINELNIEEMRKRISIVTQDTVLLSNTLLNNIDIGRNIEKDKIMRMCKAVQLEDLIESLPNGLNEMIGERGNQLSGGQQQRIALARTLLDESDVVILDEATSALDNITQEIIMNEIKPFLKGKTVIIITHRLAIIKDVDYVYVMDNHSIVEEGTPEYLSQNGTKYLEFQKYSE